MGTKTYFFTLYSLTFSVTGEINLLNITKDFSPEAEIEYYNRSKSEIKLHLVTDLSKEQVEKICDDFKIKIESNFDTRLIYKVTNSELEKKVDELAKSQNLSINMTINMLIGFAFNEIQRQNKEFIPKIIFESK